MLLHLKDVAADRGQLRHRLGTDKIGAPEMLRCARDLGLKARAWRTDGRGSRGRPPRHRVPARWRLHAAGQGHRGQGAGPVAADRARPHDARGVRRGLGRRADLDGRRAGLADIARRFDITWFMGAIHKYRRLLGEVLVASFFLQLFGLISPLFFQVVIDKVLVHRSLSTLDVLVIGLLAISAFETVVAILRISVLPHHQPHRRRARRPPVPSPAGPADGLLPGAAGRRFGGARARAGEHPLSSPARR